MSFLLRIGSMQGDLWYNEYIHPRMPYCQKRFPYGTFNSNAYGAARGGFRQVQDQEEGKLKLCIYTVRAK
ncbi:hypothetical protein B5M42_018255 [Paenibacillus athensensis]|uniref:hypothetical protein n=1 Tax=Paenibacillus athensensis TaxID=1967502 RepID=UPI0010701CCD|nr:hypothetical protein [Paenibacillus athensensis]MCD1260748.1 hypothetical protein [Paenibacillus athensensis]